MKILIKRNLYQSEQTLGELLLLKDEKEIFSCKSLELPWLFNKKSVSCIPIGTYKVKKRVSKRLGAHLHILGVVGRSYILIHSGNFNRQIQGCVLVGSKHRDIDSDGWLDVIESRITLKKILDLLDNNPITLEIQ